MSFSDVHPGDPINASNVQQVIDALKGTAGKGVPLAPVAVNSASNYALSVENIEATNSRALNVLKSDGSTLIKADATGVTLGSPITAPASSLAGSVLTDGSITSAKIADGTIATADLANASVTNAKLASDTARSNLLTNGSFDVWQRGNGPFTANNAYTADRWQMSLAGTDTLSVSKDTANVDTGSAACAACTFTLGTGGGNTDIIQQWKSTEYGSLAGRAISVSLRVRTNVANAVRIALYDGAAWVYSAYHPGNGTYQTLSATVTVSTSSPNPQVAIFFAATSTVYLDNATLVVGSQPADYAPLHPADDLQRCLRYFEIQGNGPAYGIAGGHMTIAGFAYWSLPYAVRKALTPTVTKVGTWAVSNCGQPTIFGGGQVDGYALTTTLSAAGSWFAYPGGAGQYISAEANT